MREARAGTPTTSTRPSGRFEQRADEIGEPRRCTCRQGGNDQIFALVLHGDDENITHRHSGTGDAC